MPVIFINPDGPMNTVTHHQVAVATGSRQVHVAGQVAVDVDGRLVAPGALAGQVAQALRNVAVGVAAAGATFADVVRLNVYGVDWQPEKLGECMAGVMQVAGEIGFVPAPGFLIEIQATAVLE